MMRRRGSGRRKNPLASVDECIVVSAGFAVGGRCFLALRQVASNLGEQVSPSDQASSTRYGMGYGRTTGRRDGFSAGGWDFFVEDGVCCALNEQIQNPHA